jgi:hypothetical protein
MATAYSHHPSMSHPFVYDCIKTEKFDDHEYEISKWLKLENETMSSLNNSGTSTDYSSANENSPIYSTGTTTYIINSQLPTLQSEFNPNHTVSFSFQTQLPNMQTNVQHPNSPLQNSTLSTSNLQGSTATFSSLPPTLTQTYNTQYAPHYSNFTSQFAPYTTTLSNNQYSTQSYTTTHFVQPTISQNPQYSQNIIPTQMIQPQYQQQTMAATGNLLNPQFQYLIPHQFHQIFKNTT